jgi:4'-phosphopantetheinyl transferase EntD
VAETEPHLHSIENLEDTERAAVVNAVAVRQREFAAGRWAARRALEALGRPAAAIPANPNRTPQWPPGVIGSITHCRSRCAAAVADVGRLLGIGIDVEERRSVAQWWQSVCFRGERDWVCRDGEPIPERVVTGFSCKESFFKAQFPLTGIWLEFADVEIRTGSGPEFEVVVHKEIPWPGQVIFVGRHEVGETLVLSAFELTRIA